MVCIRHGAFVARWRSLRADIKCVQLPAAACCSKALQCERWSPGGSRGWDCSDGIVARVCSGQRMIATVPVHVGCLVRCRYRCCCVGVAA